MEFSFDIHYTIIAKVALSFLLGGLIGLEREWVQKPAGLRTHMLVSGTATLLVLLGDIMIHKYAQFELLRAVSADPIRIMEAIITGISFLGAGTIILRRKEQSVEGLTTAASILFAAGLGICIGVDRILLAIMLTVMVLIILTALGYIEKWIARVSSYREDED